MISPNSSNFDALLACATSPTSTQLVQHKGMGIKEAHLVVSALSLLISWLPFSLKPDYPTVCT